MPCKYDLYYHTIELSKYYCKWFITYFQFTNYIPISLFFILNFFSSNYQNLDVDSASSKDTPNVRYQQSKVHNVLALLFFVGFEKWWKMFLISFNIVVRLNFWERYIDIAQRENVFLTEGNLFFLRCFCWIMVRNHNII